VIHGGFNTALDCLEAGVPMVVVPIAFEQPGTSARVRAAGAGVVIPYRNVTRRSVRAGLARILSDASYRRAAEGFASRLSEMNGADHAADRILAACAQGRHPFATAQAYLVPA